MSKTCCPLLLLAIKTVLGAFESSHNISKTSIPILQSSYSQRTDKKHSLNVYSRRGQYIELKLITLFIQRMKNQHFFTFPY